MRTKKEIKQHRNDLRKCKRIQTLTDKQLEELQMLDNILTWVLEEDGGKIDSVIEDIAAAASEVLP